MTTTTDRRPAVTRDRQQPEPTPPDATGPDATGPGAGGRRRGPLLLWTLAAALLLVAAGLAWKVAWPAHQLEQQRASDAAALAAGRAMAVNYSTLDYQRFDAYQQRVLDGSTGSFHDQWATESSRLKSLVTGNKATSTPTRTEAALVSADADSAEVLVGVVASTTNTAAPDGVTKTYRMDLKLSKVSGRWKVTDLAYVS
ncbi:hypothetical protein [Lapillicoccus jejuensis]|uniref:Mce-associated membrane protein n=1 Tax=Lapillicoccus jejuensis TaxID=402171 RepID=A0A542DX57_9MICO|nr:hypothetical protein [Lapillicoccus jejuensis]TQJ07504.1 Mce-associated membrane protein [Lapillicoccus jejuensis]